MPIAASVIDGARAVDTVTWDQRWAMPFTYWLERTVDTVPVAHPLLPICLEAGVAVGAHLELGPLTAQEADRAVHLGHELQIHRPFPAAGRADVTVRATELYATEAGSVLGLRYDGHDADGPWWTTTMRLLFRGVGIVGAPPSSPAPDLAMEGPVSATLLVDLPAEATWVYSAVSRLWHDVHTDPGVADAMGLPGPILPGSATLGLALSGLLAAQGRSRSSVARIRADLCRFVTVPTELTVRQYGVQDTSLAFDVLRPDGRQVVRAHVELSS